MSDVVNNGPAYGLLQWVTFEYDNVLLSCLRNEILFECRSVQTHDSIWELEAENNLGFLLLMLLQFALQMKRLNLCQETEIFGNFVAIRRFKNVDIDTEMNDSYYCQFHQVILLSQLVAKFPFQPSRNKSSKIKGCAFFLTSIFKWRVCYNLQSEWPNSVSQRSFLREHRIRSCSGNHKEFATNQHGKSILIHR